MTDAFLTSMHARHGHCRLESGHHSDVWLDLEALCLHPRFIEPYVRELAAKLRPYSVNTVCGPLNEGAFLSLMVASALDCEFTYAERFANPDGNALFPIEYRVPRTLHSVVRGKRIAIVNDVTSAGSAVRGTFADLQALGAYVVVIGSLLVLGTAIRAFAREQGVVVEALRELQHNLWAPAECPLCRRSVPLEVHSRRAAVASAANRSAAVRADTHRQRARHRD